MLEGLNIHQSGKLFNQQVTLVEQVVRGFPTGHPACTGNLQIQIRDVAGQRVYLINGDFQLLVGSGIEIPQALINIVKTVGKGLGAGEHYLSGRNRVGVVSDRLRSGEELFHHRSQPGFRVSQQVVDLAGKGMKGSVTLTV